MSSAPVPTVTLNNGVKIPQLGFGVFLVPPGEAKAAVAEALRVGYRSIDTASIYGNELEVGAALADSGIPREELFITTKLWNSHQDYETALRAFDSSLAKLGLDYLDLYLIHWPVATRGTYLEAWRALEKLYADGRVRAIGVSNFTPAHLEAVLATGGTVPAVNQIELHPLLPQRELREFDAAHGIVTEAWSPLARGELLGNPVVTGIAARLGASPAQVVLAWHLAAGTVVIPKSVTPERIASNLAAVAVSLTAEDITAIDALESGQRIGPDPDQLQDAPELAID